MLIPTQVWLGQNAENSLGWNNVLDGTSIGDEGSSGDALAAGHSATFAFVSTETPTTITTLPHGESVAYVNGIDFSQNSPGDSTAVFSQTLVSSPEPTSTALFGIGIFGLAWTGRTKFGKSAAARKQGK